MFIYPYVWEYDADPDFLGKGVEEREDSWLLFDGLLYHNADAEGHEGFAEIDDSFPFRRDRHRGDRHVRFL